MMVYCLSGFYSAASCSVVFTCFIYVLLPALWYSLFSHILTTCSFVVMFFINDPLLLSTGKGESCLPEFLLQMSFVFECDCIFIALRSQKIRYRQYSLSLVLIH